MDEVVHFKKPHTVVPFCLFQYLNTYENTFRGYVANPELVKDGDALYYKCAKNNIELDRWKFIKRFYAISPMFRPIPPGMKIICLKSSDYAPFKTIEVTELYDMFTFESFCTYFITYTKPVANTAPLFFYKLGENIFPSFDNRPPADGWTELSISPVFVIVKKPGDTDFDPNNIRFQCADGRCIPSGIELVSDAPKESLTKCVTRCSHLLDTETEPHNIMTTITNIKNVKDDNKMLNWMIVFCVLVIVGIIVLLLTRRLGVVSRARRTRRR